MPVLSLDQGLIKSVNGVGIEAYGDVIRDGQYRLQTSQFKNIADFKFTSAAYMQYWEDRNEVGTGTTTEDADMGYVTITANDASIRYMQTEYNTHIIPPYSYRFWFGMKIPTITAGACRFGFWNGDRGIYLEISGTGGVSLNIQNQNTPLAIAINRAAWDDPLDGTGASGVTIDSTLVNYYFMEYSWAGGYARFGALIDGIPRYAHTEYFGNNATYPDVLIGNPNLPIRYEVEGVGGDQSMQLHFATIQADIGEDSVAVNRVATRGHLSNQDLNVDKSGNNNDEYFSVVAIRLDPTLANANYSVVVPTRISLCCTSGANMHWRLVLITGDGFLNFGAISWTSIDESAVQYALMPDGTANTYPCQTNTSLFRSTIADGYFSNNVDQALTDIDESLQRLYVRPGGESYELHLMVTTVSNSAAETVSGSINFKEYI